MTTLRLAFDFWPRKSSWSAAKISYVLRMYTVAVGLGKSGASASLYKTGQHAYGYYC